MSFGVVNKIYLEFEEAFWPENWIGFTLLWDEEGLAEMKKLHGDW